MEDLFLGITHDLNQSSYTFIGSAIDGPNRFNVRVIPGMITADSRIDNNQSVNVFKCYNNLCINFSKSYNQPQLINVFNKVGQLVYSSSLESGQVNYSLNNLNLNPSDIYIIKIESIDNAIMFKW